MTSQSDEQGIGTVYVRDELGRTAMEIRNGVTNAFVYDAAGRTLENRQSAGGILLVESNAYDLAGRLLEHTDSADLKTYYGYLDGGRVTVQTLPGGGVQVSSQYLDGQALSVTGTAVVASFYEYGVDTNGMRWTLARTGASNSPMWEKTMTDMLGRTIRTERPSFGGGTSVVESFYDQYGRLATNRQSNAVAVVDTSYSYDDLGRVIRSGLDVNGNGVLDINGMDRVNDSDQYYDYDGTNWWSVSRSEFYPYDNSGQAANNSISMSRLTGLGTASGAGVLVAERKDTDIFGNTTVFRRVVARAAAMAWETTDLPTSIQDMVRVYSNGIAVSETSASGVVVSNEYDAIGRLTKTRSGGESREAGRIVSYNAKGQVEWEEDLAGNRTTNSYDPESGLKVGVVDALTNAVHTSYDKQGRVTNIWGATYPVAYEYDAYGRMSAMKTWRDTNGAPDVTHWLYDEASGLLTNKVHADGNGPSYQYDASGRLAVRTWARGVSTDYSYDGLGLLTNVNYSDSTPDVAFAYDRQGRQVAITDALGTRTNVYDAASLTEERMPNGTVLHRSYDGYGRPTGLTLNNGYALSYAYGDVGRFTSVTSAMLAATTTVNYAYLPDSDLISGWTIQDGSGTNQVVTTSKTYEPHRDLATSVVNTGAVFLISSYQYENDALGRRAGRRDWIYNGASATNVFGYDVRSELADAAMGTNHFGYQYDPIGNRSLSVANVLTNQYQANSLNQYAQISAGGVLSTPQYDADGNLTNSGPFSYVWDAENRLVEVYSNGTLRAKSDYDFMGRRFRKAGATTNLFTYDGWNLIQEQKASTLYSYVWGLDLSGTLQGAGGVGGLVARIQHAISGTNLTLNSGHYYVGDANGNVTGYVYGSRLGACYQYVYDPYGNVLSVMPPSLRDHKFRFSTKYCDDETGLCYYGYRFYSPGLGRWLGRDPLGERGSLNIYSFAKNAPTLFLDFLGLADVSIAMGPDLHMWVDDTHTSVKGTARALWGQNNIQMIANIAQSEFDEENQNPDAKPCNLSIQWFVSSDANPMSLESLRQNLSSVSSDLLIYIGHGAVVDGETKTPLFTSWQIAPTPTIGGVAIGKLYSFGEIFQGVQYEDPPPKQLAVSCCYSADLPKKAGGFKVYRIAPTEMQPNPILPGDVQGNIKILFKKLCCKKTAAEAGK